MSVSHHGLFTNTSHSRCSSDDGESHSHRSVRHQSFDFQNDWGLKWWDNLRQILMGKLVGLRVVSKAFSKRFKTYIFNYVYVSQYIIMYPNEDAPGGQRHEVSLELELQGVGSCLNGWWEPNLGSQKEQCALFTAELSLSLWSPGKQDAYIMKA